MIGFSLAANASWCFSAEIKNQHDHGLQLCPAVADMIYQPTSRGKFAQPYFFE
jgi:hypothetical protein